MPEKPTPPACCGRDARVPRDPTSGSRQPGGGQFFVVLPKTSWVRDYRFTRGVEVRGRGVLEDVMVRRHWGRRLDRFERDLEHEPARVREFYEVRARRVEPVGLVYLWPETN